MNRERKKQKKREAQKQQQQRKQNAEEVPMETEHHSAAKSTVDDAQEQGEAAADGKQAQGDGSEQKQGEESTWEFKENPSRVVPQQRQYIAFPEKSRYSPLKRTGAGFTMLYDKTPGEPEELIHTSVEGATPQSGVLPQGGDATMDGGETDQEPPPPEPFEYNPDMSATAPSSA